MPGTKNSKKLEVRTAEEVKNCLLDIPFDALEDVTSQSKLSVSHPFFDTSYPLVLGIGYTG